MEDSEIDPETSVEEAKALIQAALRCTDDDRYDQLLTWARDIIAPLVAAKHPDALWLDCALLDQDRAVGKVTEEGFHDRYLAAMRKAAEAGSLSAKFRLACELDEEATREESARLFADAAEGGHAYAKWCHGLNLLSGLGVERNEALGLAEIRASAELKFEGAVQFLSDAYAAGTHGFPQDVAEAARWRKKLKDKDLISYGDS